MHKPLTLRNLSGPLFGIILSLLISGIQYVDARGQSVLTDYQRADSTRIFPRLVYNSANSITWVDSTNYCWYVINTPDGYEYWLLDLERLHKKPLFDMNTFCEHLEKDLGSKSDRASFRLQNFKLSRDLRYGEFELKGERYRCDLKKYAFEKLKTPVKEPEEYWGNSFDETGNKPVVSPDSSNTAYIKDYNLYIKDKKTKEEFQLSYDGSEGEFYSSYLSWSPDAQKIAVFKVRPNTRKYMYFVEAAPDSQFLPLLHKREYLRPGDALPMKTPCLFDVSEKKQLAVEAADYPDQFVLQNIQWSKDSKTFSFEYNQRGHQVYQIIAVDAENGSKRIILNESSPTFIDYSSKYYRHDLKNEPQFIWASERDGWNHLYLFDAQSGELINQITSGEWVVRRVLHVDEKAKRILFAASGMNPGEDPYYLHYYRINFDGTGLIRLTPEKLDHRVVFAPDYTGSFFIDTYSTVKEPPVTVVRDMNSGRILMQVEKADISKLMEAGYIFPEPFVAPGRDGKTEIWGNIYRPTCFDSTLSYPVIEYIYAGPQGSFVQKSFYPYSYPFTGLAELGFIIVQIDGMGTSNRSKAFHDVCFKNLKDAGFEDRILWIKKAAEKYPCMDTSRVGIFGGSAGGQNATAGLLFHPDFYKVGVSACGCHDNRIDKIWWNEQWMGYPIGPQYAACSNVEQADKLEGKLMLILGEIDDNVDPSSTLRLAKALIQHDKEFELVILPGTNHTLGGEYGERKRRDFFLRHLQGKEPPDWNEINSKNTD